MSSNTLHAHGGQAVVHADGRGRAIAAAVADATAFVPPTACRHFGGAFW